MATISEQLTQLASIKSDIKDAIEAKGETVGNDAFSTYSSHIENISSGGGGGGFRCTNKIMESGDSYWASQGSYQYTFDGTLSQAAIGIMPINMVAGNPVWPVITVEDKGNNFYASISYGTLKFQDFPIVQPPYDSVLVQDKRPLISNLLAFNQSGGDSMCQLSIDNTGLLTSTCNSTDVEFWLFYIMVFFKDANGNLDYDIFPYQTLGMDD